MFVSVETTQFRNRQVKWNDRDTYIILLTTWQHEDWGTMYKPMLTAMKFNVDVLFDDYAINDYHVHKGEKPILRQRIIIFELKHVQSE